MRQILIKLLSVSLIAIFLVFSYSCKKDEISAPVPKLITKSVTSILSTTARCGGSITSDGGSAVIARGVCWEIGQTPTVNNSKTVDGAGGGNFTSEITGLAGNTTYFVRAYATNSSGTGYGMTLSFTTKPSTIPIVTTNPVSLITLTTAITGGVVNSDGGAPIIERGVCYSTNPLPTVNDNKTVDGAGIGSYVSNITGLVMNKYYLRAYATNSKGTGYGNEEVFSTGIGAFWEGGRIAYMFLPSDTLYVPGEIHGIIVSTIPLSEGIGWNNGYNIATDALETAYGTGDDNTNKIVSVQGVGSYAAKLCYDLVDGGYSDWYLPSIDELKKLYNHKSEIGMSTANGIYWSSSESSITVARILDFSSGSSSTDFKNRLYKVRAVRLF